MWMNVWPTIGWILHGAIFVVVAFVAWTASRASEHYRNDRDRVRSEHSTLVESLRLAGQWPSSLLSERDAAQDRIEVLDNAILSACNAITDAVCVSGNDPDTILAFVKKLKGVVLQEVSADLEVMTRADQEHPDTPDNYEHFEVDESPAGKVMP